MHTPKCKDHNHTIPAPGMSFNMTRKQKKAPMSRQNKPDNKADESSKQKTPRTLGYYQRNPNLLFPHSRLSIHNRRTPTPAYSPH